MLPYSTLVKLAADSRSLRERIAAAEAATGKPNSHGQIEAGNYPKGKYVDRGLLFTIETAKGTTRSGMNKTTGKPWSITLKNSYGYINRTRSAEKGDQMDFFVGPCPESEVVFVIDQNKADGKTFDEHKCVFGCWSSAEAIKLYHDNYSAGWNGFRACTPLTFDQFKQWLRNGDMDKPCADQRVSEFTKQAAPNWGAFRAALASRTPSGPTLNKYLNPWSESGNRWLDFGKSIVPTTAAAFPVTHLINDQIYGGLMQRHYTDPTTGEEIRGLDPTSKATELATNIAMLWPAFNRFGMKQMYKNVPAALLAKGGITMAVPSITDVVKATQSTGKATEEAAKAMTDTADLAKNLNNISTAAAAYVPAVQQALPAVQQAVKGMRENRDWATPFMTGGIGALGGNMLGRFFEDEGKLTPEQQQKQKRMRLLLTALGGTAGAIAGSRTTQKLPAFSPSGEEWKAIQDWMGRARQHLASYVS